MWMDGGQPAFWACRGPEPCRARLGVEMRAWPLPARATSPLARAPCLPSQFARSELASTSALMRLYQTAIAQHKRTSASSPLTHPPGGDVGLVCGCARNARPPPAPSVPPGRRLGSPCFQSQAVQRARFDLICCCVWLAPWPTRRYEEIEVIAKAGQGAFGSVYVAMWRGTVVAVKVRTCWRHAAPRPDLACLWRGLDTAARRTCAARGAPWPACGGGWIAAQLGTRHACPRAGQRRVALPARSTRAPLVVHVAARRAGALTAPWSFHRRARAQVMKQHVDGRRAMRTAWELAVIKSLAHPNVVHVLAVYTDMAVEKRSRRIIRFIHSSAQAAQVGGRSEHTASRARRPLLLPPPPPPPRLTAFLRVVPSLSSLPWRLRACRCDQHPPGRPHRALRAGRRRAAAGAPLGRPAAAARRAGLAGGAGAAVGAAGGLRLRGQPAALPGNAAPPPLSLLSLSLSLSPCAHASTSLPALVALKRPSALRPLGLTPQPAAALRSL